MQQEQDTCRICSGPGEPDQPLFYPCKCSGTIRYIHQDCLRTWLDHSKKTSCDVCKHPYAFTKVYAVDMPDRVPLHILIRKFVEQIVAAMLFVLRTIIVVFVWLILLPYGTLLTWRVYFRIGNILAWSISLHPHPNGSFIKPSEYQYRPAHEIPTFRKHFVEPFLETLPSDIFSGQIIASLIVLAFLAIFLLREWIQQNARPGIFDDIQPDPAPPLDVPPVPPPHGHELGPVQPAVLPGPAVLERDAGNVHPRVDPGTESDDDAPPRPLPDVPEDVRATDPSSSSSSDTERITRRYQSTSGPRRLKDADRLRRAEAPATMHIPRHPKPPRRRPSEREEEEDEYEVKRHQKRRIELSEYPVLSTSNLATTFSQSHPQGTPSEVGSSNSDFLDLVPKGKGKAVDRGEITDDTRSISGATEREFFSPPSDFEFTFSAPQRESRPNDSYTRTSSPEIGPPLESEITPSGSVFFGSKVLRPSFDYPLPDPNKRSIVMSSPTAESPLSNDLSVSTSPAQTPRRPLLASTSLTLPDTFDGPSSSKQPSQVSPSLATYRPPEDLKDDDDVDYFIHPTEANVDYSEVADADDEDEIEGARSADELAGKQEDIHVVPQLLPDTDEEEEDEPGNDRRNLQAVQVEFHQPLNLPAREGAVQPAELDEEDREQNFDEDLDGALEAVGLRGPVVAVFQNAALMFFILNISIGGGVWIPFTLGKTAALLTLEPRQALYLFHLPIRTVRILTDPWVDGGLYFFRHLSRNVVEAVRKIWPLSEPSSSPNQVSLFGNFPAKTWFDFIPFESIVKFISKMQPSILWAQFVDSQTFPSSTYSYTTLTANTGMRLPQLAEDYLAHLGKYVRLGYAALWDEWVKSVEGDGTAERVIAILLGYTVAALLAALYLNTITAGNVKSVGRAVRNAVRQQVIVFKVALFIVVELVMFPFGCGVMLDFSTLPLFPDTTVAIRLAFAQRAPVTAAFYHWLIGTMFMYQFAILLATCREILRPGCMWFIKDPQDPTFHPIRDILDRPTLAQLRKLSLSAIMYAIVVTVGVGGIVRFIKFVAPAMLPLRWKMREPLSNIPVDLLFIHLILPTTLHYFRPRKPVRRLLTLWWQWTARQLRLTSFMFGERRQDEEYNTFWSWKKLFGLNGPDAMVVPTRDGGFRRAPAGDNIAFLRDKPALVPVDEEGSPLNETGREIIAAQDTEARRSGRNPAQDYTIVYIPSDFHKRVILFIILFWLCGSLLLVSAIAVPIIGGRAIFQLFTPRALHDGYSIIIGFYLVWWSYLVGSLFAKIWIRRQRHFLGRQFEQGEGRVRANWLLFIFKRVTVYFSKIAWLGVWMGLIVPTLVSIAVELYLVIPIRHAVNPGLTPTVYIPESWAKGLILCKIIIRAHRGRQGSGLFGALDTIRRNGWRRPDPWTATRDFIIPATVGLIGAITLPPLVVLASSKWISYPCKPEDLHRLVYPVIFTIVAVIQFGSSMSGVYKKWTQSIRDKEFLVEMRLRNLDPVSYNNHFENDLIDLDDKQEELVD